MNRSIMLALLPIAITPALAQDVAKVQPTSYRVLSDTPDRRVLKFTSRPGMGVCGTGVHSHPAHLTILLTPATVKVTEHGKTILVHQKAGERFWSPAVTHETENVGGGEVRALIIEYKHPRK